MMLVSQTHDEKITANAIVRLAHAATVLARDIDIINQRVDAQGLRDFFAPLTTGLLTGEWQRANNMLCYTLARVPMEVDLDLLATHTTLNGQQITYIMQAFRSGNRADIEKKALPLLRRVIEGAVMMDYANFVEGNAAYLQVHGICSDPLRDHRVELCAAITDGAYRGTRFQLVNDYNLNKDALVVMPRLELRVYFDQPYSSSSDAGAKRHVPSWPSPARAVPPRF